MKLKKILCGKKIADVIVNKDDPEYIDLILTNGAVKDRIRFAIECLDRDAYGDLQYGIQVTKIVTKKKTIEEEKAEVLHENSTKR